jgi:large subunit ribosomal protein L3
VFHDDGTALGCTALQLGPCVVTGHRTPEKNGYAAVQLGFEECRAKVLSKPRLGELGVVKGKAGAAKKDAKEKAEASVERVGKPLRFLREARVKTLPEVKIGDTVTVKAFSKNDFVDVIGTSKGRGFMGTIRAHHFNRGPASHGSMNIRQPGSVGSSADPSHTFRGTRMGKHLGAKRATSKNLTVFDVDAEKNLLYIRGAVAGPTGGFVMVRKATTPPPVPKAQPAVKKASQKGGPEKKK